MPDFVSLRRSQSARIALVVSLFLPYGAPGAQARVLPRWSLSASPTLVIGDEAEPAKTFSFLAAAVKLSTGEIVVVDAGSNELRLFDASGRFAGAFGRRGSGPGEFQRVSWVGRSRDSLFLFDWRHARVSLYHARTLGPFATIQAGNTNELMRVEGRMSDGTWLLATMSAVDLVHPHGVYRDTIRIGLLGSSGRGDVAWLGAFPSQSLFAFNPTRAPKASLVAAFRFGPTTSHVAAGTRVWIGDGAQPRLLAFDSKGVSRGHAALSRGPRAPDKAAWTRLRDDEVSSADARTEPMRRALYEEALGMRETPYFARLLPGAADEVWVEDHCPDKAAPCEYTVVSASGVPLAVLNAPPGVRLHDVGLDHVVGVHTDPDGVESVRVYRLIRR